MLIRKAAPKRVVEKLPVPSDTAMHQLVAKHIQAVKENTDKDNCVFNGQGFDSPLSTSSTPDAPADKHPPATSHPAHAAASLVCQNLVSY